MLVPLLGVVLADWLPPEAGDDEVATAELSGAICDTGATGLGGEAVSGVPPLLEPMSVAVVGEF